MATYHLRVKTVSRGRGNSAVAAAAYRSGERLTEAATGRIRDYADRAGRVRFAGLFLPFGAPVWARDRAALWNAVERAERRHDATLAREIELSLPHELTDLQRLQLVRDFVRENLVRRGLVVDVAIHGPDRGGDPRNVHAHLLIAERPIGPGGFAAKKDRGLQSKATLHGWRANWATLCNRYLATNGHAARVDHRSFRARGIRDRQPTVPLGTVAAAMQRRGVVTPRGEQLRRIQARNALRQGWRNRAREVGQPAGSPATATMRTRPSPDRMPVSLYRTKQTVLVTSVPGMSSALASLAAVVPEWAAPDAAREVCRWGPPCRNPSPDMGAGSALMADCDGGGAVEPCSYEAEAAWIVQCHALRIEGIRQLNMPRHLMEVAIRDVRNAQRAALAAMRERRQRERPTRSERRYRPRGVDP